MATNENLIPIPGRLHSVASDEIVSGADEIYDDKLLDNLENLNTGFTNDIDTIYNTIGDDNEKGAIMEQLNTIDGRLDTIDGEISALNHIPIEVVPLNSAGTAPNVNNPKENTLYRAYNSDHTLYSDWMYKNGSWTMITQLLEPTSLEKLVGYYTCNTAANTPGKEVTTGNSGYVLPANGGAMKIKMTNANTANNVTLKIGTETAKPLWYNDERASSSNTWEENEVLSVYYDGTNYQASNSMGGGSAVGKKKLTGSTGYVSLTGTVAPNPTTSGSGVGNYRYIQYPVKEGDVVEIRGIGNGNAWTWGLIDSERNIIESSGGVVDYTTTPLLKVIPSGVDYIIINNYNTAFSNYEWYFAKKGSIGAHEMLTEPYLYGDLRTLALGHTYDIEESLNTKDKQFLKMTKAVGTMNTTDTVAIGDLKVYSVGSAGTYKALKAVNAYNGTDTEGLYAIGRPSIVTITVDSSSLSIEEDTDVEVTIGEVTQTVTVPATESETKDADIAALIAAAFTSVPGWTLTDNEDGTLALRCNTGGASTITVSSNVGETGLSITSSAVNGATTLSKYVEGTWAAVTLADYATDSINPGETADGEMWQKLTLEELISYATVQDTLINKFVADELHKSMLNRNVKKNTVTPINDPLNLEVGKTYRIVIKLSAKATGSSKGFYLRQVYNQTNPGKALYYINVGEDTADFEYTPPENSNYQYLSLWTSSGDFTFSIYIYEKKQINKVPKIYDSLGDNDNGSISQKALTEILNTGSFETFIETSIDTSLLTKTSGSLGSGKKWLFQSNCNHVVIPCSEGDEFNLTTTDSANFWGWLKDYTVPKSGDSILYTSGENRHWSTYDKPTTVPAGAKYLCLVTKNGDGTSSTWTGIALIKKPMLEILNSLASKSEVQTEITSQVTSQVGAKIQEINDLLHYPSSYIPIDERCEVYVSNGFHSFQGSAVYGNYIVALRNVPTTTGKGNSLCIFNLSTKTMVADNVPVPDLSVARSHFNTMSFSNTKYDVNDSFPLLYVCSGYTLTTSSSVGCVYVLRIINNENVYTTEIVQTINIDYGTVNGWVEFVVDADNNRAWLTGSYASRFGKNLVCINLPSISEETVTIDGNTTILDGFKFRNGKIGLQSIADYQGLTFYKGRIYWPFGVPDRNEPIGIQIINTLTHCKESTIPLNNYGFTGEPEACFIWDHEFYVVERLGRIYKLIQN